MRRHASRLLLASFLLLFPFSSFAETYFETAQHMIQRGNETEARRALKLELSLRPRNLEARYDLAVLLGRIGHHKEADALYRKNIRIGRHLPSVVNLSADLRQQGQIKEAVALLEKATHQFPAEAVPWYLLADIAEEKGDAKQAASLYLNAIKADDENGFAHLRYARFLAKHQRLTEATKQAEKAVQLLHNCAPCLSIAGDIFEQAGNKKQALALWQKSIAIEPDASLRGKILQAQGASRRVNSP